jgi:uncharacterized membrane protein YfcA
VDIWGGPLDGRLMVAIAAVLVGGFLRGFVGFGAALVIVPVLSLAYGPLVAIPALTVIGIPTLVQLLPDAIRHSERRIVVPMSAAILLSAPFGTWVLVSVAPALMKMVISALVIGLVGMLARGWKLDGDVGRPVLILAGAAGGLVQGVAGVGGPPVVAIALSRPGSPTEQRGNVLALMTAISLASLAPLSFFGLFTREAVVLGLVLLPVYGAAILVGSRYFSGGGKRHFRHAAIGLLLVIGVITFVIALTNYVSGP